MDHCVPSGVTRNHLCRAASFSATPIHRLTDLLSPQLALNVQSSGVPGTYDGTDVPASIDPYDCDVQHDCSCTVDRKNPRGYRVGWVHVFYQTDKIPGVIESGGYMFFIRLTKSLGLSSRVGTCFSSDWQNPWGYRVGWVHVFHHTVIIPGAIESGGYMFFIILTKSLGLSSRMDTCSSSCWQNPWCFRVGLVHLLHHTDKSLVLSSRMGIFFASYWQNSWFIKSVEYMSFIILTKSLVLSSWVDTTLTLSTSLVVQNFKNVNWLIG